VLRWRTACQKTHELGGANYVLWGGREGYETLLNTDMKRELDQLGRFMNLVVEHKYAIGFEGTLLIEPKPMEPTKHQYDYDVAAVYAFLQKYGLENEIKVNIEVNHATLSGHDFHHEVAAAVGHGIFGSVDANAGDDRLGWDLDLFPTSVEHMTLGMLEILRGGGFTTGGMMFDCKLRRQSIAATTCSSRTSVRWTPSRSRCSSPTRSSTTENSTVAATSATPGGTRPPARSCSTAG
jgi:xylose isomerase